MFTLKESPDEYYVGAIDSLYVEQEDAVGGIRTFKTEYIKYYYSEFDLENRSNLPPKTFSTANICLL